MDAAVEIGSRPMRVHAGIDEANEVRQFVVTEEYLDFAPIGNEAVGTVELVCPRNIAFTEAVEANLHRSAEHALICRCPLKPLLGGHAQHFVRHAPFARPEATRPPAENPLVVLGG